MKILLSHRYFWPDTPPYATMLRSIASRLVTDGHDVTVYSTRPSYHGSKQQGVPSKERIDGFGVVRAPVFTESKKNLPLRALNLASYTAGLRRYILRHPDIDLVMASTFPPIAAGFAAARAARRIKARFVYHCMDLHPEVSLYSGQLAKATLFRQLQKLDSQTCHLADAIIVLSQDMAQTLCARPGNSLLQPHIINNFVLEDFDEPLPIDEGPVLPKDKFTVLFAGNLGNFQNLDQIIAAAHHLSDLEELQFWFMGEGAAKQRLIQKAGALLDRTVFFLPLHPHAVAQRMMGQASLNLVSLKKDIYRVSYPSKTLAILAQSGPVLAVIEPQSELAQMVEREQVGFIAPADDLDKLVNTLRLAYQRKSAGAELRENAKRLNETVFSKQLVLARWSRLINEILSGKTGPSK